MTTFQGRINRDPAPSIGTVLLAIIFTAVLMFAVIHLATKEPETVKQQELNLLSCTEFLSDMKELETF